MSKKVFPIPAPSNFSFQRLIDFIFGLIGFFQAMLLAFLLAFSEVQTVFGGQFLANLLTSESVVTVRDALAVVIYPIESNMNMWVLLIEMGTDNVLRIFYSYPLQIFTSNSCLQLSSSICFYTTVHILYTMFSAANISRIIHVCIIHYTNLYN